MYAHYSLLKIAKIDNKIDIKESKLSNNIDKKSLKIILDNISNLFNNDDYININGKPIKLTFLCLNNIYYLIQVEYLSKDNTYLIKIMNYEEKNINPFNFFLNDYFIKENDNKDIILKEDINSLINQDLINKYIKSDYEKMISTFIEALILNDKSIMIYDDFNNIYFWISLIGLLLPKKYLYNYSYTFGQTLKHMKKFNIFLITKERNIESNEIYYFDFKNIKYPKLNINKYSMNISSLLLNSLDDVLDFKLIIEDLMQRHNILENEAILLNNFIQGKIEAFTKTKDLKDAIIFANNEYDNSFIASKIYTALNKFIINNDILTIYKYVYDNVLISHDEIIKSFFDNLDKFGINNNLLPNDYLNLLLNNIPFNLKDYYDYLIKYDLFNDKLYGGINNFNEWYVLLESIILDIKYNKKSIVPNDILIYYIHECVMNKKIDYLDLILDRIYILNKKASTRLLYLVFIDIFKKNEDFIIDYGIYYSFRLFERMEPNDSYRFYEKNYDFVTDKKSFINIYLEREEKKTDYYNKLNEYLINDNYKIFLDRKELIKIDNTKDFDDNYLDDLYNDFYNNPKKKNKEIFNDKVFEYLNNINNYDKLDKAINIYNKYYQKLDDKSDIKATALRKLNNIIYLNPDFIFENDLKYYDVLYEIDEYLTKIKEEPSIYLKLLIEGLNVKKAYVNEKYRNEYFKEKLLNKNKWFNNLNEYYNHYYLRYLIMSFYLFIPIESLKSSLIITTGMDSLFSNLKDYKWFKYSFINTLLNYKDNEFKLNFMIYLLYSTNVDDKIYFEIRDKILDEIKKPKKLLKEYYKIIDNVSWASDLKDKFKDFINQFIINNSNFITKLFWKLFKI